MTLTRHCTDNAADREVGAHWERQFGIMAAAHGKMFTPHQLNLKDQSAAAYDQGADGKWNVYTLPDVTIWSAPGEHHELKHKTTTPDGCYGLERYRLEPLISFANVTGQRVLYTIHDWRLAGASSGRDEIPNQIEHWFFGDIAELSRKFTKTVEDYSYRNGRRTATKVPIHYWTAARYFHPLAELWAVV